MALSRERMDARIAALKRLAAQEIAASNWRIGVCPRDSDAPLGDHSLWEWRWIQALHWQWVEEGGRCRCIPVR